MPIPTFWAPPVGRELDATPVHDRVQPTRLVACLNVWNDCQALKLTVPSWIRAVDHVIAVDGAYDTTGNVLSNDGTREYLRSLGKKVQIIDAGGLTQCEKRTRYLEAGKPGDYLFIIDADEYAHQSAVLRNLPICDVGWVMISSTMYVRAYGQPRVIRWRPGLRYDGRHHWMYHEDRLLCTHQYGGPGYSHRPIQLVVSNERNLGRSTARRAIKATHHTQQAAVERRQFAMPSSKMSDSAIGGREALQIMMYAYRDDGLAPSRLHTAINRTTPHMSLFFKARPGPFGVPEQYSVRRHGNIMTQALRSADIAHYHGQMSESKNAPRGMPCVFHQHGTLFRMNAEQYMAEAKNRNALVLLSNLELFSWTDGAPAHFLPNAMPVARYRELAESIRQPYTGTGPFRIAHSPSKPAKKGTEEFLAACKRLCAHGFLVQPVMLHDMPHREVLRQKATCHAAFDSFWLGMQCSGLESAAMGVPVIAGDEIVAQRYLEQFGDVPYTTAWDGDHLEHQIERLITDDQYRVTEAERVHRYVVDHHDESAVALRYLDLLDEAFGWRSVPLPTIKAQVSRAVGSGRRR